MKIHPGGGGPQKVLRCWFQSENETLSVEAKEGYSALVFNLKPITGRLAADIAAIREDGDGLLTAAIVAAAVETVEGIEDANGEPITKLDRACVLAIHPKIIQYLAIIVQKSMTLTDEEANFTRLLADGS
jgi:hypothetical protein